MSITSKNKYNCYVEVSDPVADGQFVAILSVHQNKIDLTYGQALQLIQMLGAYVTERRRGRMGRRVTD